MKNNNSNSVKKMHFSARKVDLLQRIITSLAILNNRYQRGFTFILGTAAKEFWSSITIEDNNTLFCNITEINGPDGLNALINYAHDLESKINE